MSETINFQAQDEDCFEWAMQAPYNRQFVDELKAVIPADKRSWDPENKVWVITSPWEATAGDIAKKFFPKAEVVWDE